MAQDELDATAEAAVPRHRYLLLAGVAGACALGVGLGLWARPAIGERGETAKVAAAPEPAPPPGRKLQIVFDDNPAPIGKPLEVMAPHPGAAAAAAPRILPAPLPVTSLAPAPPTPARPPAGLLRADAPRSAEPALGDRAPQASFAERARPFAHALIASAEAALLRIAAVRLDSEAGEAATRAGTVAASDATPKAAAGQHAEAAALAEQRKRTEAERMARLEARKAAQAEARAERAARLEAAAEARAERLAARAAAERKAERLAEAARAEALARAERRKTERLAAQARAREKAAALAEAHAEARAEALARAKAKAQALAAARAKARAEAVVEAKAEARRKKALAVLAHALDKVVAAHHAKPAPEPPRPLRGTGPIRLVSAPRCASSDPGEALACADPQLIAAERRMNRAYQQAEAAGVPAAELRRQQQRWLTARAAAAREAPWAVRDVYQARIAELEDLARNPHD